MNKTQSLYSRAKTLIPGGTQLLSKRPEQFLPGQWPAYYSRAEGCRVWDLDDKEYIDMSYMGIGACILGYADKDVDAAVREAVSRGNMSTLNVPEEVELAELLLEIHPWAEMVRYARTGGEAVAQAVRIARASTRRDTILFCGYHGWHDWYLSANLADDSALDGHLLKGLNPAGVPRGLQGTAHPFRYNDSEEFCRLMSVHGSEIGAVVMEPVRNIRPKNNFLETIREETRKRNIPLIFDEVSSGWRSFPGGIHLKYGVNPDLCVFAKGMSNGYPMAAVIGRGTVMDSAQESFISSTYWTDRIGPAAALACIHKIRACKVPEHLHRVGLRIQKGWTAASEAAALPIETSGIEPLGHFDFKGSEPLLMKSLFTKLMLEKGFLAVNAFYASYAHGEKETASYLEAVKDVFCEIKTAADENRMEQRLGGDVCKAGFQRLT